MNFIDFHYGVYYPKGGIYTIIESLKKMNDTHGTRIITGTGVSEILIENKTATGVRLENGETMNADYVVSNADLHFTETKLITEKKHQTYPQKFWDKAVMGPSAFIIYLGLDREVPHLTHHNLRFAENWKDNFDGKLFYHVSTDEVYGSLSLDGDNFFCETTSYDPRSPYSASKASSDHMVRAWHHTYKMPVVLSNCSNNFVHTRQQF